MSLVPYVHLGTSLQGQGPGSEVPLDADDLHHLTRVLRLRAGATLLVSDGHGGCASGALTATGVSLDAEVVWTPQPTPQIVLLQALPKGRKFDEVLRQVVELGADRVIPVTSQRSVVQRDAARASKTRERWAAIARAAAEQSRQPWLTTLDPVTDLTDAVATLEHDGVPLLHTDPGASALPAAVASLPPAAAVAVAVGPEGGWSDDERAHLDAAGALRVGLGPTVLRTEHAAAAAVAVLAAQLGRW